MAEETQKKMKASFSPRQIKSILNFASENPNNEKSKKFQKIFGINKTALDAWRAANVDPTNEKAIKVRNVVYDIISDKFQAIQKTSGIPFAPGDVAFVDRTIVKNFLANEPKEQEKYFQRKGYVTRINPENNRVEVRRPDQPTFFVVDPEGFDIWDLTDIASDIIEAGVTGMAGVAGFAGGSVPGMIAAGSLGAAGFESGKQLIAKGLGIRESFAPEKVKEAAFFGGAASAGGAAISKGLEVIGKYGPKILKTLPGAGKLKPDADNIQKAADRLKLSPTKGQLIDSEALQELEEVARNQRQLFMTSKLRSQIKRNQEVLESVADDIVKFNPSFSRIAEIEEAGQEMTKAVAERLAPAEEIYGALEAPFQRFPILNTRAIVDKIAQLYKKAPGDKPLRSFLDNMLDEAVQIDTLADLSQFKKNIGGMLEANASKNKRNAVKQLYGSIIESRNQSILDAYKFVGKEDMGEQVARKLGQADKIYKSVIEDISGAIAPIGKKIKKPPKQAIEEFFENHEPSKTIYGFLKLKDPRQIKLVKEKFPETFKRMKNLAIEDIYEKTKIKGRVSPQKLVTHLKKMPVETKKLIFGNDAMQKIKDMETWLDSIPSISQVGNPSRTSLIRFAAKFSMIEKIPLLNQLLDEFAASEQALRRAWIANPLGLAQSMRKASEAARGKASIGALEFGIKKGKENRQETPSFINLAPEFGGIK